MSKITKKQSTPVVGEKPNGKSQIRQFLIDEQDAWNTQVIGLAGWLNQLESHIAIVEQYNLEAYYNNLDNGNLIVDNKSMMLIESIADYIRKNIGEKEAHLFASKSGVTLTTVQSQHLDWNHKIKQAHQTSVDYLKHWAKQLKELIESYN